MDKIQQGSDCLMNGTHATRHWISWIGLRLLIILFQFIFGRKIT